MKNVLSCLIFFILISIGSQANSTGNFNMWTTSPFQSKAVQHSPESDTLLKGPIGIMDHNGVDLKLKLYPNPATTQLTVSLDCSSFVNSETVYISVTDLRGRILISVKDKAEPGITYQKDINLRGLPDDEYVLQLIKGNTKLVKKFQVHY